MKVYVICYAGEVRGVYSRKKKMLRAYVKMCRKYHDEIINDLNNSLRGTFREESVLEHDPMRKISLATITEILDLFLGEPYDSSLFTLEELRTCTDIDYSLYAMELDK